MKGKMQGAKQRGKQGGQKAQIHLLVFAQNISGRVHKEQHYFLHGRTNI